MMQKIKQFGYKTFYIGEIKNNLILAMFNILKKPSILRGNIFYIEKVISRPPEYIKFHMPTMRNQETCQSN